MADNFMTGNFMTGNSMTGNSMTGNFMTGNFMTDYLRTDYFNLWVTSAKYSLIRSFVGLPFEHPFDMIKTRMQAYPNSGGFNNTTRSIYMENQQGFSGFYRGYGPNLAQLTVKNLYRYPTYQFVTSLAERISPDNPVKNASITALTMATTETALLITSERCKVYHMTGKGATFFFRENQRNLLRACTNGFWMMFLKKQVSWFSWDVASKSSRYYLQKNWNGGEKLSNKQELGCAIFSSIFCLPFIMPLDFLKTNVQKQGAFTGNREVFRYARTLSPKQVYRGFVPAVILFTVHDLVQSYLRKMIHTQTPIL